ncbi:MAG TPA: DNA-primase RepB domain-containing protein [Allosphingosinicella sp.]|nr:DNA-primase RepB domain-containing protein [Allosphingosinicella sp.]
MDHAINPRTLSVPSITCAPTPARDLRLLKVPAPPDPKEEKGEAGEPGDSAIKVAPSPTTAEFARALLGGDPAGSGMLLCSKAGDPQTGGWTAVAAVDVDYQCPNARNNYFNCSLFNVAEGAPSSARKNAFKSFFALVLDDVGTKVAATRLEALKPTWALETSPGNYQYGYVLAQPVEDPAVAEQLQKAVAAADLCDRGALGLGRWARLPNSINGKPKYDVEGEPFRCRLQEWRPHARYSLEELAGGLGLTLSPPLPPSQASALRGTHGAVARTRFISFPLREILSSTNSQLEACTSGSLVLAGMKSPAHGSTSTPAGSTEGLLILNLTLITLLAASGAITRTATSCTSAIS